MRERKEQVRMRGRGEYTSMQPKNTDKTPSATISRYHHVSPNYQTSRPLRLVPIRVLQERTKDLAASLSGGERSVLFVGGELAGRRTWSSGWPATTPRKRSRPSRRVSMTSSENRFVKTLPGSGGIFTRVDSCSRMSRKASKSE